MTKQILAFFACSTLASAASAQSINIDFGNSGTPASDYGAVGTAGVWNEVTAGGATPLVDLAGNPTGAEAHIDYPAAAFSDTPGLEGNDAALLEDFLPGNGDVVIQIKVTGLEEGTYNLIAYALRPAEVDNGSLLMMGDEPQEGHIVDGPWPGEFQLNVTHATFDVELPEGGGNVALQMVSSYWAGSGVLSGLQIERLEEPQFAPADLNHDNVVDVMDLLVVFGNFGAHGCDGILECQGDVNGDLSIDTMDVLEVLAAWSPGPTP